MGLEFWAVYKQKKEELSLEQLLDRNEAELANSTPPDQRGPDAEVAKAQKKLSSAKHKHRTGKSKLEKCQLATQQARAVLEEATAAEAEAAKAQSKAEQY